MITKALKEEDTKGVRACHSEELATKNLSHFVHRSICFLQAVMQKALIKRTKWGIVPDLPFNADSSLRSE
jgi:hypothetical protein